MSIFNSETVEPSSNLAKGVAKEKELARDLEIKNPSARVTRTAQTGDGGKDLIIESGEDLLYYEVKNWERPMSVHDLRQYTALHKNSDAVLRVFNNGGFSDEAQRLAAETGIELTSGSDYTPPSGRQVVRWCANRIRSAASDITRQAASNIFQTAFQSAKIGKRLVYQGARWVGQSIYYLGKRAYDKLSFRQVAVAGIVFGPFWLYIKWRNDEYTHYDLIKLIGGILLSLALHELFER